MEVSTDFEVERVAKWTGARRVPDIAVKYLTLQLHAQYTAANTSKQNTSNAYSTHVVISLCRGMHSYVLQDAHWRWGHSR